MYIFLKIKKRIFIYSVIIFLVFFISISLNINSIKNTSTFINNSYESIKEFDFDCDGKNDELSIISVNSTYSIKIKNSIELDKKVRCLSGDGELLLRIYKG